MQVEDGDELRICADCGDDFVFTDGERRFFASRDLHKPSRCSVCRKAREWASQGRETTITNCASCGAKTVVPFAAASERPVFCNACIRTRRQRHDAPAEETAV